MGLQKGGMREDCALGPGVQAAVLQLVTGHGDRNKSTLPIVSAAFVERSSAQAQLAHLQRTDLCCFEDTSTALSVSSQPAAAAWDSPAPAVLSRTTELTQQEAVCHQDWFRPALRHWMRGCRWMGSSGETEVSSKGGRQTLLVALAFA